MEFRVIWSEEDGQYVGLAHDFPSLSYLADTKEEALTGIRLLVEETLLDIGWTEGHGSL